jgi:hypothetical protein
MTDAANAQVKLAALAAVCIISPAARAADEGPRFRIREEAVDFALSWPGEGKYAGMKDGSFAGGGVAIGDVTGDGLADVYLSRPFGGGKLFRSDGGWKFTDITEASGLGMDSSNWASGCSMADADNDGDLDLSVCGYDTANRLFLNDGKGNFRNVAAGSGLDFKGASIVLTWADFDRDGDADAYLVTNRAADAGNITAENREHVREIEKLLIRDPQTGALIVPENLREEWAILMRPGQPQLVKAGQRDHLYRNDGPGADGAPRFTDITAAAGLTDYGRGLSAHWWDYDDDGFPDLYVANDFHGPDRLWRNNGDGTFTDKAPELMRHTPWFSMGCDSGDLNNDGLIDFMASDMAGSNHYKDKMGMGDMDKQGWFLEMNVPRQYMRNAVYINSGAGLPFMECAHQLRVAGTDWTWAVKFADMDCDGWLDLFITNGMTGDYLNSDLVAQNTAGGTVRNAPPKPDRDMAFRNTGGQPGAAWSFAFENTGKRWGLDREGISFGAAWGDLDADGDPDLVVNNFGEPCTVYENTTPVAEAGRLAVKLKGVKSNRLGIGARVTLTAGGMAQTREISPVRGYFSSDEPAAFFGLGKTKAEKIEIRWPSGIVQTVREVPPGVVITITEASDIPKPDVEHRPLYVTSDCLPVPHTESNFDDFAVQPLLPNRLSREGPGHAWSDVDGDGDFDLFLGGAAGDPGRLVFNNGPDKNGAPQFSIKSLAPFDAEAKAEDMGVLFFDADGDGDDDLYVVSGSVEAGAETSLYQDRLYLNDGKGGFTKAAATALPAETDSGSCVCAADFDHDGDLDLFVGGRVIPGKYPTSPGSRILRNDGGKFTDATPSEIAKLERVTAAVWADLDNDSWPELATASEWGLVRVFLNTAGKLTPAETGAEPFSGWWNSVTAADLDGDGRLDLVAGNYGLNTKYHPSPGHPQRLFYGDFDESGTAQVVEAKTLADGTVLPMRGKSCSQQAIPMLSKKFPTFHSFASSDLRSIYTDAKLAAAQKFEAVSLESAIFWNESRPGSVKLKYQALPPVVQIAPVFGITTFDGDGDGDQDLVLAQNTYSPQRETGYMDGGVSLYVRNDGARAFTALWPLVSGLAVSADAKSLTCVQLTPSSPPAFFFGVNNGTARTFMRPAGPERPHTVIQLQGPKGNSRAIGARLTAIATGKEGRSAVIRELTAGSGYLSQEPPVLVIPSGDYRLSVRWPDGKVTEAAISGKSVVRVVHPEAAR